MARLYIKIEGDGDKPPCFAPYKPKRSIGDTISLYVLLGLGAMLAALLIYQGVRI